MIRKINRLFFIILAGILLCSCNRSEIKLEEVEIAEDTSDDTKEELEDHIFVYVCGSVKKAGVYKLSKGSRVYQAIKLAGGLTKDADESRLNMAQILEDEEQVYVPSIHEQEEEQKDGKINLNTATKEELMTLSGVGEAKAELIIQYRQENGRFKSIEEIMNISGIKEGLFLKIKDDIIV